MHRNVRFYARLQKKGKMCKQGPLNALRLSKHIPLFSRGLRLQLSPLSWGGPATLGQLSAAPADLFFFPQQLFSTNLLGSALDAVPHCRTSAGGRSNDNSESWPLQVSVSHAAPTYKTI